MPKKLLEPQTMLIPMPVVMVSCQKEGQKPNIITIAWSGIACSEPPMITIAIRKGRFSHEIISESKEFVVNMITESLLPQTDYCGIKSGRSVDKFKETKLTPIKGTKVNAPLIKECPINLECVVKAITSLGSHDLFIGEIVATHIDSEYIDDRERPDIAKMMPVAYCTKAQQYWGLSQSLGTYGYTKGKI
ncbi:MAG: flavin reductase family protein [Candidatus Zixiibacteriota bacterium]